MGSLESICYDAVSQRWIFAIMCFLALFNAFAMRGCLPITITEMVKKSTTSASSITIESADVCTYDGGEIIDKSLQVANLSISKDSSTEVGYDWDEYTQGIILSSFYCGYVLTHIPGGLLAEKYGGKHTLGLGIFSTAIFTLLTPVAVEQGGYRALVTLRALMGFGEGVTFPAVNVLLAHWVPPQQRSRIGSFVYAGGSIGTVFSTVISGIILTRFGWQTVFYVIGIIGAVWYLLWLVLCYDRPRDHPFISNEELIFLTESLAEHTHVQRAPVPWTHILKSKPLWASIIAFIGFSWISLAILSDFPKYVSGVLKLPVEINGYLTSFVYLSMWVGTIITSWMSDYAIARYKNSRTRVRKVGSIVGLTFSSALIVVASYIGCNRTAVIVTFAVALAMLGTALPSIMINALDLSPNYAGVLMGFSNGIAAIAGIFSPYVVGILTPHQTPGEWRLVFWIFFIISVFTNMVFLMFGSGEVQYWNDPTKNLEVNRRYSNSDF